MTTITISDDLQQRLKILATFRDTTYEQLLEEMLYTLESIIPFNNEREFCNWFEQNLSLFGFTEIIKAQTKSFPDYILKDTEGNIKNVEIELYDKNFFLHKHDSNLVDLIICAFGTMQNINGKPIVALVRTTEKGVVSTLTSISVKANTKERFDKLGTLSDTADIILNQLIDCWERYKDVVTKE